MSDLPTSPRSSEVRRSGPVLVVDFGAQYAQLIARRVREKRVYSEIVPHDMPVREMLARGPSAIILSGGPSSVYEEGAPSIDRAIFDAGVPILGICYGFQLMARALGGAVGHTAVAEYGRTKVTIHGDSALFRSQPVGQIVWMSHADAVTSPPADFEVTASSPSAEIAAFESRDRRLFGVQWHPEVMHTEHGRELIDGFLFGAADLEPNWTPGNIIEDSIRSIKDQVGSHQVICGLSGGVDSAVAAALVHRAIGDQLTCVFVDHGLLRDGERSQVENDFVAATGVSLHVQDASRQFLSALKGKREPEDKRKIIGREFIRAFEAATNDAIEDKSSKDEVKFLVQGTLYPDVVESGGGSGTAVIKSHHNVGGLPDDLSFQLIEPLRSLFKDEVREIGTELGLPESIVQRHPFPGPGLAIRIVGAVTRKRLAVLRKADSIVRDELQMAGLDRELWQCPVVLLAEVRSVGVQGDGRTYGNPIVLRPITSEDAMTGDWAYLPHEVLDRISTRITGEVDGINRVLLDLTSKPPGTIEWE